MPRDKVTYPYNTAVTIEPAGEGVLQESAGGKEEYRYVLTGERITWLPPDVHRFIAGHQDAEGIDHGQTFAVTRYKRGSGSATWHAELLSSPRPPIAPSPAAPPQMAAPPAAAPKTNGNGNGQPAALDPAVVQLVQYLNASMGKQPQAAAQLAARDGRNAVLIATDRMAAALEQSIGLWDQTVKLAAEVGLRLTPGAGDIRATAATLFMDGSEVGQ